MTIRPRHNRFSTARSAARLGHIGGAQRKPTRRHHRAEQRFCRAVVLGFHDRGALPSHRGGPIGQQRCMLYAQSTSSRQLHRNRPTGRLDFPPVNVDAAICHGGPACRRERRGNVTRAVVVWFGSGVDYSTARFRATSSGPTPAHAAIPNGTMRLASESTGARRPGHASVSHRPGTECLDTTSDGIAPESFSAPIPLEQHPSNAGWERQRRRRCTPNADGRWRTTRFLTATFVRESTPIHGI